MKKVFTHMLTSETSVGFPPWSSGMCLLLFTSSLVLAQLRAVSVAVKDESGQPSITAAVLLNSPSEGIMTDTSGRHFTCLIIKNELNQL